MTDNRIVLESAAKSALYTIIIQVFVPVFVSYALQYTWSPAVALGELESGDMGITSWLIGLSMSRNTTRIP